MNNFLYYILFCFGIVSISHSLETIEYCIIQNPEQDNSFGISAFNSSIIDTIHISSSKQSDSMKCDGFFNFDRRDVFHFNKMIEAAYMDFDTRGCMGFGGSNDSFYESSGTPCPVKIESKMIIANPDKFTACKNHCLQDCKEKDTLVNFKIKDTFGKTFLAEWSLEVQCTPSIDTTYSGSYYIYITGECKDKDFKGTLTDTLIISTYEPEAQEQGNECGSD